MFSPSENKNQGTRCSALHAMLIRAHLRWNGFLIDEKGENRVSLMKINWKAF